MQKIKKISKGSQASGSKLKQLADATDSTPMMVALASDPPTDYRRNIAGSIPRSNRYINIEDGLVPFKYSSLSYGGNSPSAINVRDAVILCQKCYYNFALFRNIIDLMTEFSTSKIYFHGGNAQSRAFFEAWLKKINIWDLQDKFFREYYRSGNVFLYRFDSEIKAGDVKKLSQVYAVNGINPMNMIHPDKLLDQEGTIPVRYILLNPADIQMTSTLNFAYGLYFKILTDYEIAVLRNPKTEEDIAVFENLPEVTKKQVKSGARTVSVPLDPDKVSMVFYKRQDYEPFAVPMGFPVLEDINFKAELKKIDMAIARTMQQIVLLITAGTEPEKGGINPKNIAILKQLFANPSVGRVLVADYTTKGEFIVPKIGELLDPKKYEIVNDDINIGLNNVFAGGDKFANQQQKVELFISRLEQGRMAFLNNFLIPEIKRVAKSLKFKNYPIPTFEDIELKDSSVMNRIYARLMELGILTPEQGFKALKTGILPDSSVAEEEQKDYIKKRDDGLYTPLLGGAKEGGEAGRPSGTKAPQTTKKISPIGSKASEIQFSAKKVAENILLSQELEKLINEELKTIYKVKKFTNLQKDVAKGVLEQVMANESPKNWTVNYKLYCADQQDRNHERVKEVCAIACEHQVDNFIAGILMGSKAE